MAESREQLSVGGARMTGLMGAWHVVTTPGFLTSLPAQLACLGETLA